MNGSREVYRLRQRLEATIKRAPSADEDLERQADFARYICVLLSGYLERAVGALLTARAENKGSQDVAAFVERSLERWQNLKSERLIQLLGAFSADWRKELEGFLVDERRAALDSVVALRNRIAHGENVGTSLAQVRLYQREVVKVVDFVEQLVCPPDENGGS